MWEFGSLLLVLVQIVEKSLGSEPSSIVAQRSLTTVSVIKGTGNIKMDPLDPRLNELFQESSSS